ncbi:methylated-DNA--[protein]-cysteine S-methyltransferase [Corynebacterium sp. HMSC29G08]|uniref:methylated-DNA--[protein]-cysteine S-methyltransferase n=1 Tax=Corynebacterium sp. HMSC29G08 TaxID=1581069 RepID=UPI0008A3A525|nr:methylated-DNA--[protein]-cysteine S-methyltransferase [Corynebacterium sp. HMSC29G08]OFT81071.1 hypothetical protein HMPREF3101_11105 [Corynebacterium sp. HMSC29G08]
MPALRLYEFNSPIGRLGLVESARGVARVLLPGDAFEGPVRTQQGGTGAVWQLEEYFAGQRREFTVPLDLGGLPPFRAQALRALLQVPYGQTVSYTELAGAAGNSKAVRAAGSACATNPLPLFIPCHRVLRADGSLGGYRGGEQAKRFLLALEGINV